MANTFEYSLLPIAKCKLPTELEWHGEGENEKGTIKAIDNYKLEMLNEELKKKNNGYNNSSLKIYNLTLNDVVVRVDPRYYRPLVHLNHRSINMAEQKQIC